MDKQKTSDEPVTVTMRIPVKYESRQIALDAIVTDVGTWAFRVQHEYGDKQIESLAEEIKLAGLLVPLVVAEASAGKYSLRDGFRRWHAMMMLVRTGEGAGRQAGQSMCS